MLNKRAILATAAGIMAAPPVFAQNLDALEKRIDALEKSGGGLNVTRSKKTMKLVISGHINRIVQYRDNGTKSGVIHATSNLSRSRIRWIGTGELNDDITIGTYIEFGNDSAISSSQDLGVNSDQNSLALDERHIDLSITSKTLGKIYIGQGSSGSESTSERDLSGTELLSLNGDARALAASEQFQTDAVGGRGSGVTVNDVFSNFDGLGRRDRIRYDTPKFAGFQITTSHGNGDAWDLALRYGGSLGGVKVTGAIAYADTESIDGASAVNGSLSVLLPIGLSFTVAAADRDDQDGGAADKSTWIYGKIGYRFDTLEIGQTRLFVEWSQVDELRALNEDATEFGIGLIQLINPIGLEFQLGYNNFDVDLSSGVSTDDIDVVTIGLRAKF